MIYLFGYIVDFNVCPPFPFDLSPLGSGRRVGDIVVVILHHHSSFPPSEPRYSLSSIITILERSAPVGVVADGEEYLSIGICENRYLRVLH